MYRFFHPILKLLFQIQRSRDGLGNVCNKVKGLIIIYFIGVGNDATKFRVILYPELRFFLMIFSLILIKNIPMLQS